MYLGPPPPAELVALAALSALDRLEPFVKVYEAASAILRMDPGEDLSPTLTPPAVGIPPGLLRVCAGGGGGAGGCEVDL